MVITIVSLSSQQSVSAFSNKITPQERHDSGYRVGCAIMKELGPDAATEYTDSHTYIHHSNSFHGGYEQAIKDCSNYTAQPNNTTPTNSNQSPGPSNNTTPTNSNQSPGPSNNTTPTNSNQSPGPSNNTTPTNSNQSPGPSNNTTPTNSNQSPGPSNNQGQTNKPDQLNNQRLYCIIINGPVYGACGNTNGQSQGTSQQHP